MIWVFWVICTIGNTQWSWSHWLSPDSQIPDDLCHWTDNQKNSTRKLFQENVMQRSHEGLSNPEYPHVNKLWPKNYYPGCTEDTLTRETHFNVLAPLAPGNCIITGFLINTLINCFMQFVTVLQYIFTLLYTTCLPRHFCLWEKKKTS